MTGEAAGEAAHFEDAEGGEHLRRRHAGLANELIDARGFVIELGEDGAFEVGESELSGMADGGFVGAGAYFADEGAEFFKDVVNRFHEAGSVADEAVTALAREAVDGSGNGEDFSVLLHGMMGCGKRTAAGCGLNDDHAEAET